MFQVTLGRQMNTTFAVYPTKALYPPREGAGFGGPGSFQNGRDAATLMVPILRR